MKKQEILTHKEAVRRALEELGGRARLKDIYPRVIPRINYKPKSDIEATIRRQLYTTPKLFCKVEGMRGWWELVSYHEALAERDKKIAGLTAPHITKDEIIRGFNDLETLTERIYARNFMQLMFRGNSAWNEAYNEMKKAGRFKEQQPRVVIKNPQFGAMYEITGNNKVNVTKDL